MNPPTQNMFSNKDLNHLSSKKYINDEYFQHMMNIFNKLIIGEAFLDNSLKGIYMRELSRMTTLDIKTIHRELQEMTKNNLVDFEIKGKIKIYYPKKNFESELFFVQTEIHKANEFVKNNRILKLYLNNLYKLTDFLIFGSFANNTIKESSDLDIVIFSEDSLKLRNILKQIPIKVQPHFLSFSNFKKLLSQKNTLAIEIIKKHILFGNYKDFTRLILE